MVDYYIFTSAVRICFLTHPGPYVSALFCPVSEYVFIELVFLHLWSWVSTNELGWVESGQQRTMRLFHTVKLIQDFVDIFGQRIALNLLITNPL